MSEPVVLSAKTLALVANAKGLRAKANEKRKLARIAMHQAVHTLRKLGLSYRDIGPMLGISHQRVSQYASMEITAAGALIDLERKGV